MYRGGDAGADPERVDRVASPPPPPSNNYLQILKYCMLRTICNFCLRANSISVEQLPFRGMTLCFFCVIRCLF